MAKPEWGSKHLCEGCGIKYYDMRRDPIICPKCGEKLPTSNGRSRRGRGAGKPEAEAPVVAAAAAKPVTDDDALLDDADDDDAADVADDTLLEDDDEDEFAPDDIVGGVDAEDKES